MANVKISELPAVTASSVLAGKFPLVTAGGTTSSVLGSYIGSALSSVFAPLTHASRHQNGGADEIATATPAANAIPKADGGGKLDSWVSDASASTKGKVQLAIASELVAATDDTKAPTAKQLNAATALAGFWLTKRTKVFDGSTGIYSFDNFAPGATGGWIAGANAAFSYPETGVIRITTTTSESVELLATMSGVTGSAAKVIAIRYRTNNSRSYKLYFDGGYSCYVEIQAAGTTTPQWTTKLLVIPTFSASRPEGQYKIYGYSAAVGEYIDIDVIKIGDYSYIAGSLSEEAARIDNQLGDTAGTGVKATTTLTSNGTNVSDGDKVTVAGKVYTFKTALTPTEGEVLIGATYTDSLDNLVAAITGGAGNGTTYSCAAAHPLVTASRNGAVVTITALQAGILGNQITTSGTAATLTFANPAGGTATLDGGADDWGAKAKVQIGAALGAGAQVGALPNRNSPNIIGYFDVVDCAAGAQVTLPAGGTWVWMVETYGATYNGAKRGTAAGGAAISGTASANLTMYYERIA